MVQIQRQFITDATGTPIGVILPMVDYVQVKEILGPIVTLPVITEDTQIRLMQQAAVDPLFLADLQETMEDFAHVDAQWWETPE